MKKIILVIESFELGGAERQAAYLAKELSKNNVYIVEVWALNGEDGPVKTLLTNNNITCKSLGFDPRFLIHGNLFTSEYLKNLLKFLRFLVMNYANPKDTIISYTYYPNFIFGLFRPVLSTKKLIWNQRDEGRHFSGKFLETIALSNAEEIITNSSAGCLFLIQYTSRKIRLIHNGIPKQNNLSPNKTSNSFNVIMTANLHAFKDHQTLLMAWREFLQMNGFPQEAKLYLAGRRGDSYPALKQMSEQLDIINHVTFLGGVANIHDILPMMDVGVLSSLHEGMPNAILEYMQHGLPVIATKLPGTIEIMGPENEMLFGLKNYKELSKKIDMLYKNKSLRILTGKKNQFLVNSMFSVETMVQNYTALL